MKKAIISLLVVLVTLTTLVSAVSVTTYGSSNGYDVEYVIDQPGWYLLPTEASYSNVIVNPSITVFDALARYKFFSSPVTGLVTECTDRVKNKLTCSQREAISQENENLLAYNAAWSYYDVPTQATFHYANSLMNKFDNAQLRKGWNLITMPPHLAWGKAFAGNCQITRAYAWNPNMQGWESVDLFAMGYGISSLSGKGMAVKVVHDCTLVHGKSNYVLPQPQLPLMPGLN